MAPITKIRLGDLFDGPSDLIVLPCSTGGTITGFVARRLVKYSIPHPLSRMKLGDVEIMPFEGAEDIAQFVAFAASVRSHSSSEEAIETIGRSLGEFTTRHQEVKLIAAPLLGAGAGGIRSELVVAAIRRGFLSTAASDATLVVHVLHGEVFDRIKANRRLAKDEPREPVRVFISHTSKDEAEVAWVKKLALFLIEQGIQARIDHFHLRRGMDLQQWMCNELALAEKVVVVCTESYKAKADGRLGGVGWETMIIQGDLAGLPPDTTKYQVVVRASELEEGLPLYLRTRYAFHVPGEASEASFRQELVTELLDLPIDPVLEAREFVL